jgi:hypothetical protein
MPEPVTALQNQSEVLELRARRMTMVEEDITSDIMFGENREWIRPELELVE